MRHSLSVLLHRPPGREAVIDGVRAIAILWVFVLQVVFFHCGSLPDEVGAIFSGTYASVFHGDALKRWFSSSRRSTIMALFPIAQLSYSIYLVHEVVMFLVFVDHPSMEFRKSPTFRRLAADPAFAPRESLPTH